MILSKFLSNKLARKTSTERALYEAIVAAARRTAFYETLGVPDTLDGRFDMIVLHLFFVMEKLGRDGEHSLQQKLANEFFSDMDRSLREMGVGDLSVGKKVRKMAEAYQGRVVAYRKAMDENSDAFRNAVARNVYAGNDAGQAEKLAQTLLEWRESIRTQKAYEIARSREAA